MPQLLSVLIPRTKFPTKPFRLHFLSKWANEMTRLLFYLKYTRIVIAIAGDVRPPEARHTKSGPSSPAPASPGPPGLLTAHVVSCECIESIMQKE